MNAFAAPCDVSPANEAGARLLARARVLAASGRPEAARPLLSAVRRLGVDAGEVDRLEARLLMRSGQTQAALALLDAALARAGASPDLRLIRAEMRLLADDAAGAAADAAEAVISDPADPTAKSMLGIALAELGRLDDALPCLREAARAEPDNPMFCLALARAQEVTGSPELARATLDDGIARVPASLRLRNAALRLAIAQGAFADAVELAETGRRTGLLDACLLGMLGHALSCLGQHEQAADAYAEALKLAPEDAYVRHLVAASGRLPAPPRAADDYVRTLFDGYAERFEQHLIGLHYRVPGLLRAAVQAHVPMVATARTGPVLDLGCGTGLAAVAMSDLPLGPWHGVDLSAAMLRQARAKGLYGSLHEGSLPGWLGQEGPCYALAVAADVLCYIGDLTPLLDAMHRRLLPGGWFVASLETAAVAHGWLLGPEGRYAHDPAHVRACASECGFTVQAATAETLRTQRDATVAGLILVLTKSAP